MEEETKDVQEVQETPEGDSKPQDEEVDVEDLKKRAEVSSQNFERAKKAEDEVKRLKTELEKKPKKEQDITFKDQLALTNAKIHEDDIDEVLDYAKFKGISITDALKSNVIKSSLEEKAELRKSAQATNTNIARRGATAPSSQDVLNKAMKEDKIPEAGTPEAELLWKARHGR